MPVKAAASVLITSVLPRGVSRIATIPISGESVIQLSRWVESMVSIMVSFGLRERSCVRACREPAK
jgi:hypothetical protein